MRTIIALFSLLAAMAFGADAVWSARPNSVMTEGFNQAGNPCITVIGGNPKGYCGISLKTSLDLTGATAKDALRIKMFQNIFGLTIMLKGPKSEIHRTFRTPLDGKELVAEFDRSKWKTSKGDKETFDTYEEVIFYYSAFRHPWQRLSITALTITKGEQVLFDYQSDNPAPVLAHKVHNFGQGGKNSAEMLSYQVPKSIRLKPTLAVIMIGTNDMLNSKKLLPYDQYEANLRKAVTTLHEAGSKVIIVTSPPIVEEIVLMRNKKDAFPVPPTEKLLKLVAIQKKVAEDLKCPVVDFREIILKHGPLDAKDSFIRNRVNSASLDGVHPTKEGYEALAEAVAETIRANQFPTETVVCLGDSITFGSAMLGAGTATGDSYPAKLSKILNK